MKTLSWLVAYIYLPVSVTSTKLVVTVTYLFVRIVLVGK